MRRIRDLTALSVCTAVVACGGGAPADGEAGGAGAGTTRPADAELARVYDRELARFEAAADSFDAIMHPLPLLRPAEEAVLRRYLNPAQLERARQLGVTPDQDEPALQRLVAEGRLVELEPSTRWWIVRELDYSVPLVTPDAHRLLRMVGQRFHERLDALGLPPYRFEITSVLRSAEDQARLRVVNPNAAAEVSTHQYATTVDIAYNAYSPPAQPTVAATAPEAPWLEARLQVVGALLVELGAARRARELEAVLGQALIELQGGGYVMVTMERLQPVYHMTVARRITEDDAPAMQ